MRTAPICMAITFILLIPLKTGGQSPTFAEKLPAGVSMEGMENGGEGAAREGDEIVFYEIYNKPESQYYDIIRYKIQRLGFVVFNNELEIVEEGLQFIENWRARMFLLEKKRCWQKMWLGRCESWRELETLEEKKQFAAIIGTILRDNLRRRHDFASWLFQNPRF